MKFERCKIFWRNMKLKSAIRDKVVHELAKALQAKIAEGGSSPAFNRKFLFVKKVMAGKNPQLAPLWGSSVEGVLPVLLPRRRVGLPTGGRTRAPLPASVRIFHLHSHTKQNQKAEVSITEPRPDITITSKETQIISNNGVCASYRRKNRDNRIIEKGKISRAIARKKIAGRWNIGQLKLTTKYTLPFQCQDSWRISVFN